MKSNQNIFFFLIKQLYTGEVKPGEKLPPLKVLANKLNVDQAALRVVLKQLEAMNLLDIRRSDGVYINDFMETGGLDFLTGLFSMENESVIDPFLVDEVLAFWIAVFPEIMIIALSRFASLDFKRLIQILDSQLENVDNIDELAKLDVLSQDIVGKLANNIVVTLLFNSLRPLRTKMSDVFYRTIDRDSRIRFIKMKLNGIYRLMDGTLDLNTAKENYRQESEKIRRQIQISVAKDGLQFKE